MLHRVIQGEGEPLVLVHGSWGDHHNWDLAAPKLAKTFRVLRYDRRGHSQSICDGPQGVKEDLDDLTALIREVGAPAHVIGNSFGALLVLQLAARSRELFRTLVVHEPPLVGLLEGSSLIGSAAEKASAVADLIRAGKMEEGARLFVESVGFGPGTWDAMPDAARRTFAKNARTWLEEYEDPDAFVVDLDALGRFDKPALLTMGDQSPPFFAPILAKIHAAMPASTLITLEGVGHAPHLTKPDDWVRRVTAFALRSAA